MNSIHYIFKLYPEFNAHPLHCYLSSPDHDHLSPESLWQPPNSPLCFHPCPVSHLMPSVILLKQKCGLAISLCKTLQNLPISLWAKALASRALHHPTHPHKLPLRPFHLPQLCSLSPLVTATSSLVLNTPGPLLPQGIWISLPSKTYICLCPLLPSGLYSDIPFLVRSSLYILFNCQPSLIPQHSISLCLHSLYSTYCYFNKIHNFTKLSLYYLSLLLDCKLHEGRNFCLFFFPAIFQYLAQCLLHGRHSINNWCKDRNSGLGND